MAPTIFIALQCCQCSTMQVKQQKKSSNKWTCVVCNQKQSVLKVFAQGYKAKDLRIFVQSFNMSRNTQTIGPTLQQDTHFHHHNNDHNQISANQTKRRTDWTQYLDPDDNQKDNVLEDENKGDEFEPKIMTEMPREMFKKPKLDAGEGDELYKPDFLKRNTNKHAITKDKKPKKSQQTMAKEASKWTENEKEPRSRQPTTAKRASKWNDYITQDDDDLLRESGRDFADHMGQWSSEVLETVTNDHRVEDDIHPDFM